MTKTGDKIQMILPSKPKKFPMSLVISSCSSTIRLLESNFYEEVALGEKYIPLAYAWFFL